MINSVEIFFKDLVEDTKKKVLKACGIENEAEGNFDVLPLAILDFEVGDFSLGDIVDVREPPDLTKSWTRSFTGTVVGVSKDGLERTTVYEVEDMDGCCYSVEAEFISSSPS